MRIGRNDPCHCGSGKKYKKCCLGPELPEPNQETDIEILERAIPPDTIQSVMDELEQWSPADLLSYARECLTEFPTLLSFIMEVLLPLPETVRTHSLLTICCIFRIFGLHYGRAHEQILEADIRKVCERNGRSMSKLMRGYEYEPGTLLQPFLFKFVADAGFDCEENEEISAENAFVMTLLYKSTIDLLDRAYAPRHQTVSVPV